MYIRRLRGKYVLLRKTKGETLDQFLNAKFEFPAPAAPVEREVPRPLSRVGDENALRMQNLSLHKELDETNKRLTGEEKKCKLLTRERDAAKRRQTTKTNAKNIRLRRKAPSTGRLR